MSKNNCAGQSLVEVVYILGMVVILLTGLVVSMVFSIKTARYSRNKATATRISRELIEEAKSQKQEDAFWTAVNGYSGIDWSCREPVARDNFLYKECYRNYVSSSEEEKIDFQVRVWWDSGDEPSGKNIVIVETNLSNWER